jgi:uncharacterized protein (DUF2141 family)
MRLAIALPLVLAAGLAQAATVTVQVSGIESSQGRVYVGLCPTALQESACTKGENRAARPGAMTFTFRDVPAGPLAIAVYQDVNGDGQLNRSGIGLPSEPYGFSNDVGRIGPPTFSGARVQVSEPGVTIPVRLGRFAQ